MSAAAANQIMMMDADRETVTVTPGRLDAAARYIFACGHCHSLALAINARLGGGLAVVLGDSGDVLHVVAGSSAAAGEFVDVSGFPDADMLLEQYGFVDPDSPACVRATSRSEIETWIAHGVLLPADEETAATFVDAVLACDVVMDDDYDSW